MLTGCPKIFLVFFSRFWKSLNIPTKWCLNHSPSSMIRKVMTLWSVKIWKVEKKIVYSPLKKRSKRGVKIKKSKFPIMRSINNGLKSYQKKFQPNRRKKFFFLQFWFFFGHPAPQKYRICLKVLDYCFFYCKPKFHAKYSGYLLQ